MKKKILEVLKKDDDGLSQLDGFVSLNEDVKSMLLEC